MANNIGNEFRNLKDINKLAFENQSNIPQKGNFY
jgi:hypothetical protein